MSTTIPPSITTSTNYTGRLLDISIFHTPNPASINAQPVVAEFGSPSQFCSGVQKLIQKYAILLLTQIGTQITNPTFGTNFFSSIITTNNLTTVQLTHLFNFANLIVLDVFTTYQANNPNIPLDEQLNSAYLDSVTVVNETANLSILLTTNAGTTLTFLVPLPNT